MKSEKLYDAITGVDDELIERAEKHSFKKRVPWRRWAAAAAAFALLIGAGAFILPRIGGNAAQTPGEGGESGHGEGSVFMSYAGPVFPLTLMEPLDGLSATRDVTLDFAPTSSGASDITRIWDIGVLDAYTLTNASSQSNTVTLVYPFTGSFKQPDRALLTLDGAPLDTTLYAGPYSGGFTGAGDGVSTSLNLNNIKSFDGYKALLEDGEYFASAFEEYPSLTDAVTVYEFTNITDGGSDAVNPTLNMAFNMDYDKSIALTYGFNGGRYDPDTGATARHFSIPEEGSRGYGAPRYVIILGEDIGEYTLQGYENGGCEPGEEIDGAGATIARYETTLGELLDDIARAFYDDVVDSEYDGDANRYISAEISYEMYLGEVLRFFAEYGVTGEHAKERYDFGALEDTISETVYHKRVMYVTASITVPANSSVSITASTRKQPSYDFACSGSENTGVLGYELATSLGSCLSFTGQSASIINTEGIEIVRDSFGFDIANGITQVELDMSVERYFIEVRPKE